MPLRLPDGALGTLEASKIASGADDELTIELRGTKGALRWNAMEPNYVDFYDRTKPECALGGDRGWTQIESVARYAAPGGAFLPPKNAIGWDPRPHPLLLHLPGCHRPRPRSRRRRGGRRAPSAPDGSAEALG